MKTNSLLWKIEHPDFVGTNYLFGTMHVQDQRAFRFNEIVLNAMAKCDAFATEFNLDEAVDGMPLEYLQLPNNQTYENYLTNQQINKLEQTLRKQTGIELQPYIQMKPLILIQMITTLLLTKDEQYPLDEYLFRAAKQQGKELLGLESYEEQLAILKRLPLSAQFKSLVDISKNFKRFRKQILKTTSAYESADTQKIFKAAKKSAQGMRKTLLYNRNMIMVNRFMEIGKEKTILTAIGAGHLGGKKGVLRLLKIEGCSLKPIKNVV